MNRFWNYSENGNELRLEGEIASDSWWGDEVTPKAFREELEKHPGPLTVYIDSPGGDVFAASQIYTMLMEHKGDVTVKIDSLAASAASVIAMAGSKVLMSPTAYMMIHDPLTAVYGNRTDLKEAIKTLDEIKEGLLDAYELKSGREREELSALMAKETWLSAKSAIELGLADGYIERPDSGKTPEPDAKTPQMAARAHVCVWARGNYTDALVRKILDSAKPAEEPESKEAEELRAKLIALAKASRLNPED